MQYFTSDNEAKYLRSNKSLILENPVILPDNLDPSKLEIKVYPQPNFVGYDTHKPYYDKDKNLAVWNNVNYYE